MQRSVRFPIKGTYYYAASEALELNILNKDSQLSLKAEPDNAYDGFALQLWLRLNEGNGYLIGYIPRTMSKPLSIYLKHNAKTSIEIVHLAQFGKHIEIDCLLNIEQPLLPYLYLKLMATWSHYVSKSKRFGRRISWQN